MSENTKRECAIVRDLMPLSLDGVCSRESGEYLQAHLTGCDDCRRLYDAMRADNGMRNASPAPRTDQTASLRALRRFFRRRVARNTLIAVLALLLGALVAGGVYVGLWGDTSTPLDLSRYEVSLWRTEEGFVFPVYTYGGTYRGYVGGISASGEATEDGYTVHYAAASSLIPRRLPEGDANAVLRFSPYYFCVDGTLYAAAYHKGREGYWLQLEAPVAAVYQGTKRDERVIYRAGDEIPLCGDQSILDAFYAYLQDEVYPQTLFERDENSLDIPLPASSRQ